MYCLQMFFFSRLSINQTNIYVVRQIQADIYTDILVKLLLT